MDEPLGSHIHGWMNAPELFWLHKEAMFMRSIVEVGSLHGRSAFALLSGCQGPVYCIDPWTTPGSREGFLENVGHFPNLTAIQGWSPDAALEVPGNVDMVFIDGSHEFLDVMVDIETWFARTLVLICGHDYSDEGGFPGVKKAVREFFGDEVQQAKLPGLERENSPIWEVWI